jgi:elongator complex protein 3
MVRELHVYGPMVPVGGIPEKEWQHKGWGIQLLKHAEKIAKEKFDAKQITVTSGLGVREYYLKQGYHKQEPYVIKTL